MGIAWDLFGAAPTGARRIQAICDYVHNHIAFDYQAARSTRTAWEALEEVPTCAATTRISRSRSAAA